MLAVFVWTICYLCKTEQDRMHHHLRLVKVLSSSNQIIIPANPAHALQHSNHPQPHETKATQCRATATAPADSSADRSLGAVSSRKGLP